VLEDGTDDAFPEKLLLGATPKDKGLIARRKGRAIAGPAMIGWGRFPFVTGEHHSAADITAFVTVDFAKALELSVPV